MPKQDVLVFSTRYKVATYLGITPAQFGEANKYSVKIYPLFIFLLFLTATVYSLVARKTLYVSFKTTHVVIDSLICISEILFIWACVLGSLRYSKNWTAFRNTLTQLDKKLDQTNFKIDRTFTVEIFMLTLVHVVFISLHCLENYAWTSDHELAVILSYMTSRFVMYYQIYSVIVIRSICCIIKTRYIFLNKHLSKTVSAKWLLNSFQEHESDICVKLNEVGDVYGVMYDLVEEFNTIFGWQIFFLLQYSTLKVLNVINYVLLNYGKDDGSTGNTRGLDLAYLLIYCILAGYVVMTCDGVSKGGRKITDTCYLLQTGMTTSVLKKELLFLGQYTKELTPRFTAAGFYEINQSVLAALFSAVTTYLFICIQFNMSM